MSDLESKLKELIDEYEGYAGTSGNYERETYDARCETYGRVAGDLRELQAVEEL